MKNVREIVMFYLEHGSVYPASISVPESLLWVDVERELRALEAGGVVGRMRGGRYALRKKR